MSIDAPSEQSAPAEPDPRDQLEQLGPAVAVKVAQAIEMILDGRAEIQLEPRMFRHESGVDRGGWVVRFVARP